MTRDTFEAKGEACHLTKEQKRFLKHIHENAQALADEDGGWQDNLAAVVDSGETMVWQLEQAFPFLDEGDKDE
jgi:hypothetical protein